jgi:hypothetical protein
VGLQTTGFVGYPFSQEQLRSKWIISFNAESLSSFQAVTEAIQKLPTHLPGFFIATDMGMDRHPITADLSNILKSADYAQSIYHAEFHFIKISIC